MKPKQRLGRQHDSKNIDLDSCLPLGLGNFRRNVAVASGVLIMLTILFWLVTTPLIMYLVFVGVLVVIAKWLKK